MAFKDLPIKKQKYIKERAAGKTKMQAALDAGYAESSARAATAIVETPDVRAAFAEIMRRKINPDKIAQRIAEGLNAKETKFFQYEGEVTDSRDVIAWSERRQYAALAADLGGYFVPPKQEPAVNTTNILVNAHSIRFVDTK